MARQSENRKSVYREKSTAEQCRAKCNNFDASYVFLFTGTNVFVIKENLQEKSCFDLLVLEKIPFIGYSGGSAPLLVRLSELRPQGGDAWSVGWREESGLS